MLFSRWIQAMSPDFHDFGSGGLWASLGIVWGAKTNLGRLRGAQMVQQCVNMGPRWSSLVKDNKPALHSGLKTAPSDEPRFS